MKLLRLKPPAERNAPPIRPTRLASIANKYSEAPRREFGLERDTDLRKISLRPDAVKRIPFRAEPRWSVACVYARAGNKREALVALERALERRHLGLIYLKVDPVFDPLCNDPRFQRALRRMGLAS